MIAGDIVNKIKHWYGSDLGLAFEGVTKELQVFLYYALILIELK